MAGKEKKQKRYERLDPKNDFIFKKLFTSPGNEDLLIDLLNAILKPSEEQKIRQVAILNPIKTRDHQKDKEAVMDILARAGDGTMMTIEIQVADEHDMQKRATYYWSIVFASQMLIGMQYAELRKTISINILNYIFFKHTAKHHTVFHLREETEGFKLTDVEELRFIELPKMLCRWKQGQLQEEEEPLTKWFLLLEANEDQEIARELEGKAMSDPVLDKAIREWERLSQDPRTRAQYLSRLKWKMDYMSGLKSAESKGRTEGKAEGKVEGKIEGKVEMAREAIDKYLEARFGEVSLGLQQIVKECTSLEQLDRIIHKIYTAATLEDARTIIEGETGIER